MLFHYPFCHCKIKRQAKPINPRHFFAHSGGSGPFGGHASSHPLAVRCAVRLSLDSSRESPPLPGGTVLRALGLKEEGSAGISHPY